MHLVVAVRPEMQLVALNLTVNLGSIDDPPGQSGMAHMLEHVTLSGSTTIGTLNPELEAEVLSELDRAHAALASEEQKRNPDPAILTALERSMNDRQEAATRSAESGEILGGRLEARGAVGLNATTSADATQFFASLPASELELWISLEADRLRHPIFRRFYSERNVVLREIAGLTGGRPTPQERLLGDLFPGAPVAQPLAGNPQQVQRIDRPMALTYFYRYYRPENMAIAVVGNVNPEEVRQLCIRYFGDWRPDGSKLPLRSQQENPSPPAASVIRSFNSVQGPIVLFAFPQSAATPAESAAVEAISELINSEDLSPLSQRLVQMQSIAWDVGATSRYPSEKQTAVFLLHVYGKAGTSDRVLVEQTSRLLSSLNASADEDIQGAIFSAEMHAAAQLDDPQALASVLAFHQAVHGDWRVPFQRMEELQSLKVESVRAAARRLFKGLPSETPETVRGQE
jgi:predicted Zn-dependent peptidase